MKHGNAIVNGLLAILQMILYVHTMYEASCVHFRQQPAKYSHFRAKEAPQEQPSSALGLSMILNDDRISSLW